MNKQAEIANDRAIEHWQQERYDDAITQWEEAARDYPDVAEIPHNLGNAYAYQGNMEKAIDLLKRAISIDSSLIEAYNKLGSVYYKQGNLELALLNWKQALKLKPDFKEARDNLRRLQNVAQFDVDSDIPTYQHGDQHEGSGHSDEQPTLKGRIRRGFGRLFRKNREIDSD